MTSQPGRDAQGLQPDFDKDYAYGAQGEAFVTDIVEALQSQLVEVKRDRLWWRYLNLYVERACRKVSGRWEESGIKATKSTVWVFVLGESQVMIAMPTGLLRQYCEHKWGLGHKRANGRNLYLIEETDGSNPTKGFKLNIPEFFQWLQAQERNRRGAA